MGRPQQMSAEQQAQLGRAVLQARSVGVPWKVLESVYGRSRAQLWRYAIAKMQHHECCGAESA